MEGQGPQYSAGWYPNPQGPGERYYDGSNWTDQFRAGVAPGQPQKNERSFLKGCLLVTLGALLVGAVLIGGCVAIIGSGVDAAEKEQGHHPRRVQQHQPGHFAERSREQVGRAG